MLLYMVQLIINSESIAPSNPKTAPDAPTEMFERTKRPDIKLPPSPAMTYSKPIRTVSGNREITEKSKKQK